MRALGVIGVHFRIGDDTVGADHVAAGIGSTHAGSSFMTGRLLPKAL